VNTVPHLVAGIAAATADDESAVGEHIAVVCKGHLELAEDVKEQDKLWAATKMSITEILQEIEISGRGKCHCFKTCCYEQ
jgi:hypothetical protein